MDGVPVSARAGADGRLVCFTLNFMSTYELLEGCSQGGECGTKVITLTGEGSSKVLGGWIFSGPVDSR